MEEKLLKQRSGMKRGHAALNATQLCASASLWDVFCSASLSAASLRSARMCRWSNQSGLLHPRTVQKVALAYLDLGYVLIMFLGGGGGGR